MKLEATKGNTRTLPNFLIIGAVRSGSSALASYLRNHPQVFMAERKELEFFDVNFRRGIEWYGRWFADAGGASAVGEASPSYMYDEHAPRRIADLLPNARLIAILRNPVDRAYSHYWRVRSRGRESLEFREAIAAEPERLASGDPTAVRRTSYLDRGRYLRQLQHVCRYIARGQLHVVIMEHMSANPMEQYGHVCRFLDIDDEFRPPNLGKAVGSHRIYRSKALLRLYRRPPEPIARAIRRWNEQETPYPPIDPEVRKQLISDFEPEIKGLEVWLGKDLSVWRCHKVTVAPDD
jgi:hypothetical protein